MRITKLIWRLLASLPLAIAVILPAWAQDTYPNKPIRIILPFPPGGSGDILARLIGNKLTETWKVPVLVESRPGANTMIGAELVAKSAPDGYTLLMCIDATLALNPYLFTKIPYDPIKDFTPITPATTQPLVLAVNPSIGVNSVADLIALAKAKPGQISFAYGVTYSQIAGEVFNSMAGIKMTGIAYKGGSQALIDVIGGTVPVIFDALGTSMGNIRTNKIKGLAVTSATRFASFPELPTLAESGLTGYDMSAWTGLVAPAGVSRNIITRLHREITRALALPEIKGKLAELGQEVYVTTPEEFAQVIKSDQVKFQRLVKLANIPVQ